MAGKALARLVSPRRAKWGGSSHRLSRCNQMHPESTFLRPCLPAGGGQGGRGAGVARDGDERRERATPMSVHIHLKDGRDVKVEASKIDFDRMVPERHKAENLNRVSD